MTIPAKYTADTRDWILCPADEVAAQQGMLMDLDRGVAVVDWIESNCCLYEGDLAGQKLKLLPAWKSFFIRLFGWVRWSGKWGVWVRRFNRFGFWAAKKNGKSPCLAALNIFLLCGDGEPGQKVYMGAKNGDQARIAQEHAIQMIRQSPNLADLCHINNTTMNIRHIPSNSRSIIITGDNTRGIKAKEGFNGSVLFDEMHVVNDEMWRRVSRAGISRRQPLIGSVSTTGNDRDCIGYHYMMQGRDAAEHRPGREDLNYLHIEYSVPDEVPDIDIVSDPEKYLKLSNPGWGVLVDPEEIVADCKRCWARGGGDWSDFLMYRANRWVNSANPWLDQHHWSASMERYDASSLAGRECVLGLDLARRLDMVGACFTFPWPEGPEPGAKPPMGATGFEKSETVRTWPMAWLNEETVKMRDAIFGLSKYARDGYLNVTPGNTTDFTRVKADLRRFVENYGIRVKAIYFDKTYAEELTQQLVDGDFDDSGRVIVAGWGCDRIHVPQNIVSLTGPSCELDRRVKRRLIRHPGNPVFDWQVSNVEAYRDINQNIRPVKPAPHSGKSVDLILALVMSLIGCMKLTEPEPQVHVL